MGLLSWVSSEDVMTTYQRVGRVGEIVGFRWADALGGMNCSYMEYIAGCQQR